MTDFARILAGTALILGGVFASAALAQSPPAAGQKPPVPDEGTTQQESCISDGGGFKMIGDTPTYTIELTNKCEQRLKCQIFVYVISAKGPVQGHSTLTLPGNTRGKPVKESYVLKVKMLGGMAQSTRECKAM